MRESVLIDPHVEMPNAPASPDLNAANCVALYYQLTGGQDSGMDELTFLNYWMSEGLGPDGRHKIIGYVAVDSTNETEVMTALWLFENLMMTLELPDAFVDAMDTMENGFVWNLSVPLLNPDNGACDLWFWLQQQRHQSNFYLGNDRIDAIQSALGYYLQSALKADNCFLS